MCSVRNTTPPHTTHNHRIVQRTYITHHTYTHSTPHGLRLPHFTHVPDTSLHLRDTNNNPSKHTHNRKSLKMNNFCFFFFFFLGILRGSLGGICNPATEPFAEEEKSSKM